MCKLCHTEMFSQLHMYMCGEVAVSKLVEPVIKLVVKLVSAMSIESGGERVLKGDMSTERWVAVILGWIPPAKKGGDQQREKGWCSPD